MRLDLELVPGLMWQCFSFPVRAQVANSSANVTVVEGSTAVLVCKAEGYPTPHVAWIASNGTILQNRTTDTNLIFTNVSRNSSGTYRCNASNELGSHSVTTNLVVWCKYFFLVCMFYFLLLFYIRKKLYLLVVQIPSSCSSPQYISEIHYVTTKHINQLIS